MEVSFSDSIKRFLSSPTKLGTIRNHHASMYVKKIKYFESYCEMKYCDTIKSEDKTLWRNTIQQRITLNELENSMVFIVDESRKSKNRSISKMSILIDYLIVVSEYFRFLDMIYHLSNVSILSVLGSCSDLPPQIISLAESVANLKGLSKILDKSPIITRKEAKALIKMCDKEIDKVLERGITSWEPTYNKYNTMVSCLATKLIFRTGLSCDRLPLIRLTPRTDSDIILSGKCETISISAYNIKLPVNLSRQLYEYLELRKKIKDHLKINEESFFMSLNGTTKFGAVQLDSNQFVGRTVKRKCEHSSYLSVAKYAIIQMMLSNIGRDAIVKITGHGYDVINDCVYSLKDNVEYLAQDKTFVENGLSKHDFADLL